MGDSSGGYSAKVGLTLIVAGLELSLSHVGASGIVVRDMCSPIPACDAKIVVKVDDSVNISDVFLPHGVPGPHQPFAYL